MGDFLWLSLGAYVWGYLFYHRSLFLRNIQQPAITYWVTVVWINVLSFLLSLNDVGWKTATQQLLCWSIGSGSIGVHLLRMKHLAWRFAKLDIFCMVLAGIGFASWLVLGPTALLFLLIAMSAAVLPLLVSSARGKESACALAPFALGSSLGLFSVEHWDRWQEWAMPLLGFISFGGSCLLALGAGLRKRSD